MRQYETMQEYRTAQATKAMQRNTHQMRKDFWAMKAAQNVEQDVSAMQADWYKRYQDARTKDD